MLQRTNRMIRVTTSIYRFLTKTASTGTAEAYTLRFYGRTRCSLTGMILSVHGSQSVFVAALVPPRSFRRLSEIQTDPTFLWS